MARFEQNEMLVQHYDATDEEKAVWEQTLRRGNRVLKTYHTRAKEYIGPKYSLHKFRKDVFDAVKNNGGVKGGVIVKRKQIFSKTRLKKESPKLVQIGLSETDLNLILAVKKIEFLILSSFSKLIYKVARKWSRRKHGSSLTFDDFQSIGSMATINATYQFNRDDIKLVTYVTWAIHRKILNETNNAKPLSAWPQKSKKLYGQFERLRNQIGMEVSFEEVTKMMDLGAVEIDDLRSMLTQVIHHSDMGRGENNDEEPSFLSLCEAEPEAKTDLDELEAVAKTQMNEIEKDVLQSYLFGGHGWATAVAARHINPTTSKPFSRRAPRLILDRVLARIRGNMPVEAEAA